MTRGRPKGESTNTTSGVFAIRGVSNEAKNAARLMAAREGKSLGKWVTDLIMETAARVLTQKKEVARPEDIFDILSELNKKIENISDLKERIDLLEKSHKRSPIKDFIRKFTKEDN